MTSRGARPCRARFLLFRRDRHQDRQAPGRAAARSAAAWSAPPRRRATSGTAHAMQNNTAGLADTPGERHREQQEGRERPASPGKRRGMCRAARRAPPGRCRPWRACPGPRPRVKKAPPLFSEIATNHGATIAITSAAPPAAATARAIRPSVPRSASTSAASAGTAGTIGPLTRMPTPIAPQNACRRPRRAGTSNSSRLLQTRARAAIAVTSWRPPRHPSWQGGPRRRAG